jgi:hypothetical protein
MYKQFSMQTTRLQQEINFFYKIPNRNKLGFAQIHLYKPKKNFTVSLIL